LVAPIAEAGRTARNVYLPDGTWTDWYTDKLYAGGQFIKAQAPLDHIPLFGRGGRVVPMLPVAPPSTMDHFPELVELHVFVPREKGEFVSYLHEDDGTSTAHASGKFWRTTFTLVHGASGVSLHAQVDGQGFPAFRRRRFRMVLHGLDAKRVTLNGKEQAVERNVVEIDNRAEPFELEVGA
jgi:alpha-glucosidase